MATIGGAHALRRGPVRSVFLDRIEHGYECINLFIHAAFACAPRRVFTAAISRFGILTLYEMVRTAQQVRTNRRTRNYRWLIAKAIMKYEAIFPMTGCLPFPPCAGKCPTEKRKDKANSWCGCGGGARQRIRDYVRRHPSTHLHNGNNK